MTRKIKFGDLLRDIEGIETVRLDCDGVTIKVACRGDGHQDYLKVSDIGNGIELVADLESRRLDWMILRGYPDDMSAEEREFVLRVVREHIDAYIRLAAEQGATA